MLAPPQIVQTTLQPAAILRLTIPRAEIHQAMGPGLREVLAAVADQGLAPTGPWFTHHRRMDPRIFDFAIGVPVGSPIRAVGRVTPGELPAARVARAVHQGGYEGLGPAWGELGAWIAGQGLETAEDLWERYVTGPESSPDPADWRTELNRPLRGP